ncbi:MAG: S41 family peptidase [Pseudomonadales bacterium]
MKTTFLQWPIIGCLLFGLLGPVSLAFADDEAKQTANDNAELPLEELQTFTNVFGQIRSKYVEEVDDKTLLRNAIRGMLDGLDPHSVYLDNEAFENLQEHTNGEFGGLGLEVGMEDGFVRVISPIDDTPADKAGILAGDLIIKLDDRSVKGMSLPEAITLMRGPPDSEIKLTIAREGEPPFEVTLTRAVIEVKSVKSRVLEPGYGYLRISQFQNNSGSAARKKLEKMLKKDPDMKGLVLDLRNNPGGVLQAAVEITDLFINDGLIVYTEGRVKEVDTRYNSDTPDLTNGLPLVVLVNGGSASASEIVAGALQDHQRAVIVGTETFGKGSVQSVLPLSKEHAIKLTTALYYTPDGRSIQAQGIIPDIEIRPAKITPLKQSVVGVTEADLNKRLDNASGGEDHSYSKRLKKKSNKLSSKDNQLYDALNLLKGISLTIKKAPKATTASTK